MRNHMHTVAAALFGILSLGASAATFADNDRWRDRGNGWGHAKHAHQWNHHQQHQHRYYAEPYGYVAFQAGPPVVYAPPPAYYPPRYDYAVPPARYVYPVAPSFSFGMTIPLD